MIQVSKHYDKKPVLKDISISFFYGTKIGVLGLNGSGKSTLLRIFAGIDKEFNGQTSISPGLTVGLLDQEPGLDNTKTVRDIVEEGLQETVALVNEFNRINELFANPMSEDEMNRLIERQGEVQEKIDAPWRHGILIYRIRYRKFTRPSAIRNAGDAESISDML
jgi:sulfate-transporting ATPase